MGKKGFTLLEILVVLTVLAILIGIAVPRIKGMQDQANIQKAKGELKTLQTAVETYKLNTGSYPTAITGTTLTNASPAIITANPADPFLAGSDTYGYKQAGNYYVIYSVGMDSTYNITSINSSGVLTGTVGSNICVTNSGDASLADCIR